MISGGAIAVNVVLKVLELRNQASTSRHPVILPLPTALVLTYPALDFNFTSWMSDENLRVLRSEQSSTNVPALRELVEQKDHWAHVVGRLTAYICNTLTPLQSPLAMVKDKKPRKRLKRRSSWRETLRGFTSGGETDAESHRSLPQSPRPDLPTLDTGAMADAESDSENDFSEYAEKDRPLQARIKYKYEGGARLPRSESALERQQLQLSLAVAAANSKAMNGRPGTGTRLTMSSRTGYFADRIISPSMMRAMAILYIGPKRNPDFGTDWRISPLLTPSYLLAQFPPVLLQCGEKDPFVDDTVIFAGRIREAKRARKVELDLLLSGKSARFGEGLRMSSDNAHLDSRTLAELKRERDKLAKENEEDWVQMTLFSEWSHGYLQMASLMKAAIPVINELGDWIHQAFVRYSARDSYCAPLRLSNDEEERLTLERGVVISETELMRRRRLIM